MYQLAKHFFAVRGGDWKLIAKQLMLCFFSFSVPVLTVIICSFLLVNLMLTARIEMTKMKR